MDGQNEKGEGMGRNVPGRKRGHCYKFGSGLNVWEMLENTTLCREEFRIGASSYTELF